MAYMYIFCNLWDMINVRKIIIRVKSNNGLHKVRLVINFISKVLYKLDDY